MTTVEQGARQQRSGEQTPAGAFLAQLGLNGASFRSFVDCKAFATLLSGGLPKLVFERLMHALPIATSKRIATERSDATRSVRSHSAAAAAATDDAANVQYMDFCLSGEVCECLFEFCDVNTIKSLAASCKLFNAVSKSRWMWRAKFDRENQANKVTAIDADDDEVCGALTRLQAAFDWDKLARDYTTVPRETPLFHRVVYCRYARMSACAW
jgi:hypothetical protein